MREVRDRRARNTEQRCAELRQRHRLRNPDDRLARGLSDYIDDLVNGERLRIRELIAPGSRGRLPSTQLVDCIDDEVARHAVESIVLRSHRRGQQHDPRIAQNPLDDEVRSVELLRLAGAAVTDDDRWPINYVW